MSRQLAIGDVRKPWGAVTDILQINGARWYKFKSVDLDMIATLPALTVESDPVEYQAQHSAPPSVYA